MQMLELSPQIVPCRRQNRAHDIAPGASQVAAWCEAEDGGVHAFATRVVVLVVFYLCGSERVGNLNFSGAGMKGDEKKCPQCAEVIKKAAKVCKHCGHQFSDAEIAAQAAKDKKTGIIGCAAGLVLLLVVSTCVAVVGSESTPTVSEQPAATAKADAIAFYRKAIDTVGTCDRAGSAVAAAAALNDLVAVFQAVDRMESACLSTSSDARDLEIPTTVGAKAHKSFTEALKICDTAYVTKWSSARTLKEALDSQNSIKAAAELKDASQSVAGQAMACAGGLLTGAMEVGATPKDLGI